MNNFKYMIFIISMLALTKTLAQTPFVPQSFSTMAEHEEVYNVCEIAHGRYLFTARRQSADSTGFVFVTDNMGNVLKSKFLFEKKDTMNFYGTSLLPNADETISLIGGNYNEITYSSRDLWFAKIDTDLNVISNTVTSFNIADTELLTVSVFYKIDNKFYGAIVYRVSMGPGYFVTLIQMNSKGDVNKKRNLDLSFFGGKYAEYNGLSCLVPAKNPSQLLLCGQVGGYLSRVDTSFTLIDTTDLQNTFSNHLDTIFSGIGAQVVEISPGIVIVGNIFATYAYVEPYHDRYGIAKYNTDTKKLIKLSISPRTIGTGIDTLKNRIQYDASMVGMVNSGNAVYTLGHSIKWGSVRYIAVAKYDTAANPKWVSYLGDGLHNFKANSIYSCKDGSILVNGLVDTFFWDSFGTGYYVKDDFYVIKLDSSNGYPLSIVNVSEQLRTGIVIYPNPAQEELHIKGAVLGSVASIYNSVGQLMMQETIRSSDQVVPIQQLASGNYLYQINDKNGQKLSSGKWIKR